VPGEILLFDTPQGRKPHGCSGDAHPTGSRSRLKGLPGPSGRDLQRQVSEALNTLWLTRRAPRPRGVRPCPHGNGFPWNAPIRFRWPGARCPGTELRPRRLKEPPRRPSGSSPHTPHHCRCNGVACGGLTPQTVSCGFSTHADLNAAINIGRRAAVIPPYVVALASYLQTSLPYYVRSMTSNVSCSAAP